MPTFPYWDRGYNFVPIVLKLLLNNVPHTTFLDPSTFVTVVGGLMHGRRSAAPGHHVIGPRYASSDVFFIYSHKRHISPLKNNV